MVCVFYREFAAKIQTVMKTKRNICYHGKTHRQLCTVHAFGLVLPLPNGRLSASNISRAMTIDDLRSLVEQDLKEIESELDETP